MTDQFHKKIVNFCKKHHYTFEWESLKFGFQRAKLTFTDSKQYTDAQSAVCRLKDTHCSWNCIREGEFEGFIYLMPATDKTDLEGKLREEKKRNDDWWQRYHDADAPTRRKMASGEIA